MPRSANKSIEDFKVDLNQSLVRRAAQVLNWAAKSLPGRPVSYQLLTKIVLALPRTPKEESADVISIMRKTSKIRDVLMNDYQRGLVSHPGHGIRATMDTEDLARTQYEKNARRVVSAVTSLDKTRSIINPSDIHDQALRSRVNNIGKAAKILVSNDVLDKLRLPEAFKNEADE
jgi:hypothetical protein